MLSQGIGSAISGTTYPSDDPELVAVEADYAVKEAALQAEIDNIESSHPGYDEYRYDLAMIEMCIRDSIMAIWSCVGYTVLLCFTLFKTGSLAKAVFNAH